MVRFCCLPAPLPIFAAAFACPCWLAAYTARRTRTIAAQCTCGLTIPTVVLCSMGAPSTSLRTATCCGSMTSTCKNMIRTSGGGRLSLGICRRRPPCTSRCRLSPRNSLCQRNQCGEAVCLHDADVLAFRRWRISMACHLISVPNTISVLFVPAVGAMGEGEAWRLHEDEGERI